MGWPGPMTHRQYEAWLEWEAQSLSRPDRLEYYLAQACCEIRRVMSTQPDSIKVSDFILEFKEKREPTKEEKETFSAGAKIVWAGRMTMPITVMKPEEVNYVYPPNYTGPRHGRGDGSTAD